MDRETARLEVVRSGLYMTDHYATLNIPRDASVDAIVRAWREAASLHHPDKGGDADKFHAAREAYACLMNREMRATHDATLGGIKVGAQMMSAADYELASNLPWERFVNGQCPVCFGTKELLVANSGFWTRKACPACAPQHTGG